MTTDPTIRFGFLRRLRPIVPLALLAAPATAAEPLAVFVFDQLLDAVLRIEDRNGDGDTLDAGEVTVFIEDTIAPELGIENAQGLLALGPGEMLATDDFAPDNIVHLRDLDGDGDAFDAGEASVYHAGALPGGFTLTNPVCLSNGPGDALYVLDNNTLDELNPEAIYGVEDLNDDGDGLVGFTDLSTLLANWS